jgi:hypothetical protein
MLGKLMGKLMGKLILQTDAESIDGFTDLGTPLSPTSVSQYLVAQFSI